MDRPRLRVCISTRPERVLILPRSGAESSERIGGRRMAKSILISNVLPEQARAMIPKEYGVDYNDTDTPLPKAELIQRLHGKQALICHIISTVDEEVLAGASDLKAICNVAVGFNNIDVAACRKRGVVVTHTPHGLTQTTADFARAPLLAGAPRRGADGA